MVQYGQCHNCVVPTEIGHCLLRHSPDSDGGDLRSGIGIDSFPLGVLCQGTGEWLGGCPLLVQRDVSGVAPDPTGLPLPDV